MSTEHRVPGGGSEGGDPATLTGLLARWREGDADALADLMPAVYGELHRQADRAMRRERADHTLQPTALVHEAILRLADGRQPEWRDRGHFYATTSRLMRRILVDHARGVQAQRRGGGAQKLALHEADRAVEEPLVELLALDQALDALEAIDPRKARVIELRFFGGMSVAETAAELGVSGPTVILDTRLARAWLFDRVQRGDA